MKKILLSLLVAICFVPTGFGQEKQQVKWLPVTQQSKPWTRWWWNGSAFNENDIKIALKQYADANLGGTEITPIYGARGTESKFLPFLSPGWMKLFQYTLDESKRQGLGVDLANASGWPFGGPWVEEKDACKSLLSKTYTIKGGSRLSVPVIIKQEAWARFASTKRVEPATIKRPVTANENLQDLSLDQIQYEQEIKPFLVMAYNDKGEKMNLTGKLNSSSMLDWTAPAGSDWTIYAVAEGRHGKQVERAGPGGEGDVIDHFARQPLDNYLKKFDQSFEGYDLSYLRYYFNDSYEVDDARGESNYTPKLFAEFKARRGYSLDEYLPQLLDSTKVSPRVVHDYRLTLAELMLEQYTRPWQQWAAKQGKGIRNQSHGSPANILDLYAVSDVPEIEGINLLSIKYASSASHVMGKPLTSCEAATWLGEHFESNLDDVKTAVDRFFLGGVNHIFYHGTCMSPADAPWPGWLFYAATHFAPANPFWKDFGAFNQYVSRVQAYLQAGKPYSDLLVYYPASEAYSEIGRRTIHHFHHVDRDVINPSTVKMLESITTNGYTWDFISDAQMVETRLEGKAIATQGGSFKTILIPETKLIPIETYEKIIALAKEGATVLVVNHLPSDVPGLGRLAERQERLKSINASLKFAEQNGVRQAVVGKGRILLGNDVSSLFKTAGVSNEPMYKEGLSAIRRTNGVADYYFVANQSEKAFEGWVSLCAKGEGVAILNPMNGKKGVAKSRVANGEKQIYLQLLPNESLMVEVSGRAFAGDVYPFYQPTDTKYVLNGWSVTFTEGGKVLPPVKKISTLGSWTEWGAAYQYFSGTAVYTTTLPKPESNVQTWCLELSKVAESASVYLNGEQLETLISPPFRLYIDKSQLKGNDRLEIHVSNSMANRMIEMDRKEEPWKIFYNINMSARKRENNVDGVFNAAAWSPKASGLLVDPQLYSVEEVK